MTITKSLAIGLRLVRDAILATDIQNFCIEQFGLTCQVQIGVDRANPPKLSDFPTIYFSIGARTRSQDFTQRQHAILEWVTAKVIQKTVNPGQSLELLAFDIIDQFANMVEALTLKTLKNAGYVIIPLTDGPHDEIVYPFAVISWPFEVSYQSRITF